MAAPELATAPVGVRLSPLCSGALEFLEHAYDAERALFSYSARVVDGRYVNDFEHPLSVRYTINTLLGLQRAAPFAGGHPLCREELVDDFLARQGHRVTNAADLGLLLALLVEGRRHEDAARRALSIVAEAAARRGLNVQEVAWMLWGTTAALRAGHNGAEPLARRLLERLTAFAHPATGLPRHTASRYRGHVVSFGSLVYYLRALREAAEELGDGDAATRFFRGVSQALELQGPNGEWPWMIGVANGLTLDMYPVFTVHQDSMAMLFLLPARDAGVDVSAAIEKSLAWNFGANQLHVPLLREQPFGIYRSIERAQRLPRARRYARTLVRAATDRPGGLAPNRSLRINDEVRSYHLGWILFAWAGRADAP
jgi:hypothetical protein